MDSIAQIINAAKGASAGLLFLLLGVLFFIFSVARFKWLAVQVKDRIRLQWIAGALFLISALFMFMEAIL